MVISFILDDPAAQVAPSKNGNQTQSEIFIDFSLPLWVTPPHNPTMKYFLTLWLLLSALGPIAMAQAPAKSAPVTKATFVAASDQLMAKLEEFNTVLESAKDTTTAEAAKLKLAKINKEIEALSKAAAALGEPSSAIQQELDADPKLRQRAQAIRNKLVPLSQRIATDETLLAILRQSMIDFQRASSGGTTPAPAPQAPATPRKR